MNLAAIFFSVPGSVVGKRYSSQLVLAVVVGCLVVPNAPLARQNSITGSLALGHDFDSNVFKSDLSRVGEGKNQAAPQFSFTSEGLTDSFSLGYAPTFTYNQRREDHEMVQALSFTGDKGVSSRWKVTMNGNYADYDNLFFEAGTNLSVTQNFLRADSATQAEIVRILFPELAWDPAHDMASVISQLQGRFNQAQADQGRVNALLFQGVNGARQQYRTSEIALSSEYAFADKSAFILGYHLTSQDNKTGRLADHLGQTPSVLVSYQINQQWRAAVGYDLSFDTYDTLDDSISDDSTTNHPHLQVDYRISPQNLLFWNYDYQQIDFTEPARDTQELGGKIGWNHGFDKRTSLTTSLGSTFLGREEAPDEREYTLDLGLTRRIERGSIGVYAQGMTAKARTLTDTWERSRQSWELSSDLTYQLKRDLSSTGRMSYGQWDSWGQGFSQNPYAKYQLGAGLHYLFKRWYTVSLAYDYNLFDTDSTILDDYTEHLVSLKLAGAKELWRW